MPSLTLSSSSSRVIAIASIVYRVSSNSGVDMSQKKLRGFTIFVVGLFVRLLNTVFEIARPHRAANVAMSHDFACALSRRSVWLIRWPRILAASFRSLLLALIVTSGFVGHTFAIIVSMNAYG